MIRALMVTTGVTCLATMLAYTGTFLVDRFIGHVSLDLGFGIVFLAFVGSAAATGLILAVRHYRRHYP